MVGPVPSGGPLLVPTTGPLFVPTPGPLLFPTRRTFLPNHTTTAAAAAAPLLDYIKECAHTFET